MDQVNGLSYTGYQLQYLEDKNIQREFRKCQRICHTRNGNETIIIA